jgi:hypothetical protein
MKLGHGQILSFEVEVIDLFAGSFANHGTPVVAVGLFPETHFMVIGVERKG